MFSLVNHSYILRPPPNAVSSHYTRENETVPIYHAHSIITQLDAEAKTNTQLVGIVRPNGKSHLFSKSEQMEDSYYTMLMSSDRGLTQIVIQL